MPALTVPKGAVPIDPQTHRPQAPPPRDWGKAPVWDVAGSALWNLPSTYTHATLEAVRAAARQKSTLQGYASASEPMSMPFLRMLAGQPAATTPGQVDAKALPGQISAYLGRRYGSPEAVKRTLATDSGGALMDLQAAASLPAGGEGFLARFPAIEDALRASRIPGAVPVSRAVGATARAADTAARVTNPVHLGLTGGRRAVDAIRTAGKVPAIDATGAFTPAARTVLQKTFPNLTDTDFEDPTLKDALVSSFGAKGVTQAAAREGMLKYHGAPTPRGPITQQRPVGPAVTPNADAVAQGKQLLADKGDAMVGGPAPDPTRLGATVRKAATDSAANTDALYKKADSQPGGLLTGDGPADFAGRLRASMTQALTNAGFSPTALAKLPGLTATNKAFGDFADAATAFGADGQISFPDVEKLRRYGLGRDVPGMGSVDPKAAQAMRQGFDQAVEDHLNAQQWAPGTLPDAATNYSDARAAYQQHQATFVDPKTANPVIKKAVGVVDPADGATFTGADDVSAQNAVNSNLFKGKGQTTEFHPNAQQTYNAVEALGPDAKDALDDHIRKNILGSDNGLPPGTVDDLVNSPIGSSVFSPDEAAEIRRTGAALDVLNPTYPKGGLSPKLAGLVGPLTRKAVAGGVLFGATQLLPGGLHHAVGDLAPAVIGMGMEGGAEKWFNERAAAQALTGAPAPTDRMGLVSGALQGAQAGARAVPAVSTLSQVNPAPKPPPTALAPGQAPADLPDWDVNTPEPSTTAEPLVAPKGAVPVASPSDAGPTDPQWKPPPQEDWDINAPPPKADEDRPERAAGGQVIDMTEHLMARAERAQKAAQASTKPLLGLSDDTVARALQVAQRGF
jgi:hypothetical protein